MKNIKTLLVSACLVFFSLALNAQFNSGSTNSPSYVTSLDSKVGLTDAQKSEVTTMFNGLMADIQGKTSAEIQSAKAAFIDDVRKVLTPAQVARLDSPLRRRQ